MQEVHELPATGVIIDGLPLVVPGIRIRNFHDDPLITLPREDGTPRTKDEVTLIVLHSTLGAPDQTFRHAQTIIPGLGPSSNAGRALVELWGSDHRCAGAHMAFDFDGMGYCLQDLHRWVTYHATTVNRRSIGIEYRQGRARSEFYDGQIFAGACDVDWKTIYFGIQRQIPKGYRNRPCKRLASGAADFCGVIGHRDQSDDRGAGDPGDAIMASLGYEAFDLDAGEDLEIWRQRQRWAGMPAAQQDGIPGPKTRGYLIERGFTAGLWALPPKNISIPSALRPATA